jgi:hypothetical protein
MILLAALIETEANPTNITNSISARFYTVLIFLLFLWLFSNYAVQKIKSGSWVVPDFLKEKFGLLKGVGPSSRLKQKYKINLVQKEVLDDGTEFIVMEVEDEHILMSKTLHHGVRVIKTLEKKNIIESAENLDKLVTDADKSSVI